MDRSDQNTATLDRQNSDARPLRELKLDQSSTQFQGDHCTEPFCDCPDLRMCKARAAHNSAQGIALNDSLEGSGESYEHTSSAELAPSAGDARSCALPQGLRVVTGSSMATDVATGSETVPFESGDGRLSPVTPSSDFLLCGGDFSPQSDVFAAFIVRDRRWHFVRRIA